MKLALVGSGEYLPPIDPLDRFLFSLLDDSPMVSCLPTAAGSEGPARIAYWTDLAVQHFSRLGVPVESLPVIDRTSANDKEMAERIQASNFIYLSGGKPDYLFQALNKSLVWQAIMSVLERGGLLAGCSAGAMILGERIPAFPTWRKTFNLLNGVIIVPHFDEIPSSFLKVMSIMVGRGSTLVGIDGFTALVRIGEEFTVAGQGSVTVWNRDSRSCYFQNQAVTLPSVGPAQYPSS